MFTADLKELKQQPHVPRTKKAAARKDGGFLPRKSVSDLELVDLACDAVD